MSEIVFEILKVIIMVAALVFMRYVVPWIKTLIKTEQMESVREWVSTAVLMVQQVYSSKTGAERKAIVIDLLKDELIQKNIAISDEQLNALIEAAVKVMRMEEAKGDTTTVNVTASGTVETE